MGPTGVLAGGWAFVWTAYGLTGLALGGYAAAVHAWYRRERLGPRKPAPGAPRP